MFALSISLISLYVRDVLSNPGIADTFDPRTGPIIFYTRYGPGTERLYAAMLLPLLFWQILLFLARIIEGTPLKKSEDA